MSIKRPNSDHHEMAYIWWSPVTLYITPVGIRTKGKYCYWYFQDDFDLDLTQFAIEND